MSEIHHTELCPVMSRAVTFPAHELSEDGGNKHLVEYHEDHLIEIECRGKACAWYIEMEGFCSIKFQALTLNAIFERDDS